MKTKLIYITAPDMSTATSLAKIIIEEKLAACVNILSPMESYYLWKGKLETNKEIPMLIKTKAELEIKLISRIKREHPYEIPCILSLSIDGGNIDFLKWIESSV